MARDDENVCLLTLGFVFVSFRFRSPTAHFDATDLGRVASHYYIESDTIMTFNDMMNNAMQEPDILYVQGKRGRGRDFGEERRGTR